MTGPSWLRVAEAELRRGIFEVIGPVDNPRIVEYHSHTTLDASDDEVPWCSSFLNWCVHSSDEDLEGTRSARARSWLAWGIPITIPAHGAIVVLKRGTGPQPGASVIDAPGHVGFYVGPARSDQILVLGGNQSNSVCVDSYPESRVLGYRWPA